MTFRFKLSAHTTIGIDLGVYLKGFEEGVLSRLKSLDFTSSLGGVVLFPTVCDPSIIQPPEYVSYKRSSNGAFVAIHIPYAAWTTASPFERIDLMAANLKTSVERIAPKRLNDADRQTLLDDIEQTRIELHSTILRD